MGLTFRVLGDGHWSDYTQPVKKWGQRLGLRLMSWLCLVFGFYMLGALAINPFWSYFMTFTVIIYYMTLGRGEL